MQDKKTEFWVGLVSIVALVALVLGLVWGKGVDLFSHRIHLRAEFENIKGLKPGDPVTIFGVRQGEVETLEVTPTGVTVFFWVKDQVPLYDDLRLTLEGRELMGGKQLALHPGESGRQADTRQLFSGTVQADFFQMLDQGRLMLSEADSVIQLIKAFLVRDPVSDAVSDFQNLAAEARQLLAENRSSLRETLASVERLSARFEDDSTAVKLTSAVSRLDSTLCLVSHFVRQADSSQGTVGKLVNDRWLYDQLIRTTNDLDSLITDIQKNPKKYIHFSLF